jgi:RNA polymerase sigma-70 factor, ECF subfamily
MRVEKQGQNPRLRLAIDNSGSDPHTGHRQGRLGPLISWWKVLLVDQRPAPHAAMPRLPEGAIGHRLGPFDQRGKTAWPSGMLPCLDGGCGSGRRAEVSMQDELVLLAPRLRRYARALVQGAPGPSEAADELVSATLLRLRDHGAADGKGDLILRVYSLVTQINRENHQRPAAGIGGTTALYNAMHVDVQDRRASGKGITAAISVLQLEEREALFLVVIEGFNYAQAARILHISRGTLVHRLGRARARLATVMGNDATASAGQRPTHLRLVK